MIETVGLVKVRGQRRVVDDAYLKVAGGRVTAFLGPNGAGKSSTMRLIAGLDRPTAGTALVDGRPIGSWEHPASMLGGLLDPPAIHPRWRVHEHLRYLGATHGLSRSRVTEVVEECGLDGFRDRRGRELSLGMRQRLGIAMAILANPANLMLDEPANGLDPQGMRWLRRLLRHYAEAGAVVLLSSHQMREVQDIADDVAVILNGRIVTHRPIAKFLIGTDQRTVVRTPDADRLGPAIQRAGGRIVNEPGRLVVVGLSGDQVGRLAFEHQAQLWELHTELAALEDVYLDFIDSELAAERVVPSSPRRALLDIHTSAPGISHAQPANN
ncbi:ABC-2 type transport system ATP-binding protein [Propionibacterium cyclohexanicum]|uniref:ABC-2 type transport system ATP-binding protein n=1 Tax=Propionibacterium cyclohexanicum TaxID=64702 RepID=A0A1H9QFK1_9ACTN|nr:ATP-binding cassette domain-containing protein [Propionibacterium cyclohexanicum]SER59316.1 ABC-2 type transport system ATP-binding protein [Propionibacterium cyclohexanicum]